MKKFAFVVLLAVAASLTFSNTAKSDNEIIDDGSDHRICYSQSKVKVGFTYYDCGTCKKVYNEVGKGVYTKCF